LKLELSSLREIERWILSWGGDAKVVKPRELMMAARQAAQKILYPAKLE
jgi:predicted DNA-binding transcriptional regulator YafY